MVSPRYQSYQLVAPQTVEQQLPFWAKSVLVDNPGGRYVQIPGAGLVVPPYKGGSAAPLVAATTVARANTNPPTGIRVNESGNPAVVTWTDELLATSAGAPYTALAAANAISQQFALSAGGSQSSTLTFWANSITVENAGGQWLNIVLGSRTVTIPPFTGGRVIALGAQTQTVSINTTPPAGQTNTGAGAAAQVTFTDLLLPEAPGAPSGQNLTPSGQVQIITAQSVGPAASQTSFSFSDTTQLTNGQKYNVLAILPTLLYSQTATAVSRPYLWSMTYNATQFWNDQGALGSSISPGVAPSMNYRVMPPGLQITGATGAHFSFTALLEDGSNFAINQVTGAFAVYVVPVAL